MSTLTVRPKNGEQEKALRTIFDAFKIDYEEEPDETAYLTSTEANRKALDQSVRQLDEGKGIKVSIEDLTL